MSPISVHELRFGTLLGPEKTPGNGFFSGHRFMRLPNAFLCGRGGGHDAWSVWLCVECCIVDASILL